MLLISRWARAILLLVLFVLFSSVLLAPVGRAEVSGLVCTEQFSVEMQNGISAAPPVPPDPAPENTCIHFYIPPETPSAHPEVKCCQCSCPLNSKTSFLLNIRSCIQEFLTANLNFKF